jgi:hypothetical protein
MAFDIVETMKKARRVVHEVYGIDALYSDDVVSEPVEIRARWHNKLELFGDPNNEGYAQIIQGIDRIVVFPEDTPDVEFIRGGRVEFSTGQVFVLNVLEPKDGPLQRVWQVTEAPPT